MNRKLLFLIKAMLVSINVTLFIIAGCAEKGAVKKERENKSFYVDGESGDDRNSGLTADKPIKTLKKAESLILKGGDSLLFRRGTFYEGTLRVNSSGSSDNYIVISSYGDKSLPAPAFTNSTFDVKTGNFGNCIRIKGSYIIVEELYFHNTVAQLPSDSGGFEIMWELGAVFIEKESDYSVVRNNEFFDCGVGIKSYGNYILIDNNYIHDCNRVLKEWNWGPIGIWLGSDNQEVCNNRIFNYSAVDPRIIWGPDSYGGGADGGAIEIDDARIPKTNISIHNNYSKDCQGFIEVTWKDVLQNPDYRNFSIHHNISDDFQQFIALWRGAGCKIENNTIIRRKRNVNDWGVFNITQTDSKNYVRNNIVVVENDIIIFNLGKRGTAKPSTIISNNLYFAASGNLLIGLEGPGENYIIGNPLFVNYSNIKSPLDLRITDNSPARNKGQNLGYTFDFIKTTIPNEGVPDIGAFEYSSLNK